MLSNLVKVRIIHLRKLHLLSSVPCGNNSFLFATIKTANDSRFTEYGNNSRRTIHLGKFLLTGNENSIEQKKQTNQSEKNDSTAKNDSKTNENKTREPSLIRKLLRIKDFVDLIIFGFLVTGIYFAYQKVKEKQNKEKEFEVEWVNLPNYKHKLFTCSGFYLPEFLFKNLSNFKSFEPKKDDVWVISFPKSGTTWVQEIVYLIMNNCNFEKAKAKSIEERSPFFDFPSPGLKYIKNMESPRVIKSHLPLSFLPEDLETKSKVIYITRNPKDTSVSYYHFTKLSTQAEYKGTFQDFLEFFKNGKVPYGPWWKHVDEFSNRKNVLLIHYEDLHEKPHEIVREICQFLGKDLSEKEIDSIITWCLFDNMKQNTMVNYDWYKEIGLFRKEGNFFRKGKIGDWLNHYSRSDSIEFDETINKNLNYKKKFNYGITEEELKAIYSVKID